MKNNFTKKYLSDINSTLNDLSQQDFNNFLKLIKNAKKTNNKIIFVGNGGSAAIASHVSVDFIKACKIRAINFNEADLITCFSNDYGYENWVLEALKSYAEKKDVVVLISSSGQSKNILNAAKYCSKKKIKLITFTGFKKNNPIKKIGNLNFWVNSSKYNIIEMTHHIWILMAVDYLTINK
jgi:D-sedoheptulose 7-phosphate isomerase